VQWTDTRLVLSSKMVNLPRLDTLYVYVTDASGVRSRTGVRLCSTCTTTTPKEATQVNAR